MTLTFFSQQSRAFFQTIKFEHSIFALPFAYLGLFWSSEGLPTLRIFLLVTLAMVSFRTMAMGINRVVDAEIDKRNPRTEMRAIPAGKLSPKLSLFFCLGTWLIFLGSAYILNEKCFRLTWVPTVFAILYPFMKRFSWTCHFVLGFVLGVAPYGAWLATGNDYSWVPGLLMIGVATWVAGFDIIYALQDYNFDRDQNLNSIPVKFGQDVSLLITRVLHGVSILAWFGAGMIYGMGMIYYLGLGVVAILLLKENWMIMKNTSGNLQEAFFKMNAWVSITYFFTVCFDLLVEGK